MDVRIRNVSLGSSLSSVSGIMIMTGSSIGARLSESSRTQTLDSNISALDSNRTISGASGDISLLQSGVSQSALSSGRKVSSLLTAIGQITIGIQTSKVASSSTSDLVSLSSESGSQIDGLIVSILAADVLLLDLQLVVLSQREAVLSVAVLDLTRDEIGQASDLGSSILGLGSSLGPAVDITGSSLNPAQLRESLRAIANLNTDGRRGQTSVIAARNASNRDFASAENQSRLHPVLIGVKLVVNSHVQISHFELPPCFLRHFVCSFYVIP